ncbi:hypothetical protein [Stenotrophomonas sp. PS02298]|uniref:hypothetical protein n=1 Tax=Stenotrophomonas sp. PS02298 TaxID=2991424 RepID=UPI00249CBF12|nr:hypothetical protein [Stenotrophomonas sp. PS02298]
MSAGTLVSGKELAAHIGCRPSYIVQLKREGRVVPADGGKGYLLEASVALFRDTRSPAHAGVAQRHASGRSAAPAAAGEELGEDDDDAIIDSSAAPEGSSQARRSRALADKAEVDAKAAQRDLDISLGLLLDRRDVEAVLGQAAGALRAELERMADTLAPQLAATVDEVRCRELVWNEVSHSLEELSRAFREVARPGEVTA